MQGNAKNTANDRKYFSELFTIAFLEILHHHKRIAQGKASGKAGHRAENACKLVKLSCGAGSLAGPEARIGFSCLDEILETYMTNSCKDKYQGKSAAVLDAIDQITNEYSKENFEKELNQNLIKAGFTIFDLIEKKLSQATDEEGHLGKSVKFELTCTEAVDRIFSYIRGNNWSKEYTSQTMYEICCDGLCNGNSKSEIEYRVSGGTRKTNLIKDNIKEIRKRKEHLVRKPLDEKWTNQMQEVLEILEGNETPNRKMIEQLGNNIGDKILTEIKGKGESFTEFGKEPKEILIVLKQPNKQGVDLVFSN